MIRQIKKYGWIPDLPDYRDRVVAPAPVVALPAYTDISEGFPPIWDQGAIGSCVAHGVKGVIEYQRGLQGLGFMDGSRLFIYYNGRQIEGDTIDDTGLMVRDGIKSVITYGECPEVEWPYDIAQFAALPPSTCYSGAVQHEGVKYARVDQTLYALKYQLAHGEPFVFGFTVYESFESDAVASTGVVPMPGASDSAIGGHCVAGVGYSDVKRAFLCRNSWGTGWGDSAKPGHFWIPYDYITNSNLAADFWEIRLAA